MATVVAHRVLSGALYSAIFISLVFLSMRVFESLQISSETLVNENQSINTRKDKSHTRIDNNHQGQQQQSFQTPAQSRPYYPRLCDPNDSNGKIADLLKAKNNTKDHSANNHPRCVISPAALRSTVSLAINNSIPASSCDRLLPSECLDTPNYFWRRTNNGMECTPWCKTVESSSKKCGPSFIIIGAQKAATTSLFLWLGEHPHFSRPSQKELHFYDNPTPTPSTRRVRAYLQMFPSCKFCMSGEGTPAYSMLKSARDKILEDWPDVKLILLIRDPAKRARSLYDMITSADWLRQHNYNLKKSRKLYMTFREAMTENFNKLRSLDMIDEESGTLNMDLIKSVDPKKGSTFIERGMYASIIEMWLQKISSDQLLIVRFEDLVDSTTQSCVLRQILRFIGLQHRNLPKNFQLALPHANDHHKKQSDGQSLDELDDFYRPFNRRLNKLMGMDMGYPT